MAAPNNPIRGEAHYAAKLTADDVRLIRALLSERDRHLKAARALTAREIGGKFGVSGALVERIGSRAAWIHV